MKRFQADRSRMLRQAKRWAHFYCRYPDREIPEWIYNLGYWRKSKALGCNKTGCWCKRDKILKIKTRRDLVADVRTITTLAEASQ